jgi:adenylate cyclase
MKNKIIPPSEKITPDFVSSFTAEFDREIMVTDRTRAFLICGLSLFAVLWFIFVALFLSSGFPFISFKTFHNKNMYFWLIILFAGLAVYESFYGLMLTLFLKKEKTFPTVRRFGNALVEISIPTVMIYLSFEVFDSVQTLVTPIVFIYFIFISLSALRLMFTLSLFTGIVAAAQYFWISLYVIHHSPYNPGYSFFYNREMQIAKSFLMAMVGLITGIISIQIKKKIRKSLLTIEEKKQVINIFGQHVSPIVVDKLIQQKGELGSETRFVCVMFLDIRDFTALAESKASGEIVQFLNALFGFMIDIINHCGGSINKFLGDGFMAVFGAPISSGADCRNAVDSAMQILARLDQEIAEGRIAETKVGIGIHAGMVVTGHVGSSQRKEYTIIGDVVNLTARIEQLNKEYNSQLLVSKVVWDAIQGNGYTGKDIGLVDIRGHTDAVRLYRLA